MKLVFALLLLAFVCASATDYDILNFKDTWSGDYQFDGNLFYLDVTGNGQLSKGIMFIIKNSGTSPGQTYSIGPVDWDGKESQLQSYYQVTCNNVGLGEGCAVTIPGTFWAKEYHHTMTATYRLKFNVTSPDGAPWKVMWHDIWPVYSDDYLSVNGSDAQLLQWGLTNAGDCNLLPPSTYAVGLKMQKQLDHYFLNVTADFEYTNTWGKIVAINPDFWSIDNEKTIPTSATRAVSTTCFSKSGCELALDATYFVKLTVSQKITTAQSTQFTLKFYALNSAASIAISMFVLAALVLVALL